MTKQQKNIDEDALVGLSRTELDAHLAETTASDSLKSYPHGNKSNDAAVKRALEVMSALEPHQQAAVADELKKSLRSHKDGDGVPDGTAEKSRKLLKDAQKTKKAAVAVKNFTEAFPEFNEQPEELKERFRKYMEAHALKDAITELFVEYPSFKLLFNDTQIDVVQALADKVEALKENLAAAEFERDMLVREAAEREQAALQEEVLYDARSTPTRRRTLDHEFAVNEEGQNFAEPDGEKVQGSMRTYVEALNRSTRHVDNHTAKENLMEAWKVGS
jgi:hypothetical protein